MMAGPSQAGVERFRDLVAQRLGLHFDDAKLGFLEEVLRQRVETQGRSYEAYLSRFEGTDPLGDEVGALADRLTVGETYFFRNIEQFHAFAEIVLPDRMRVRSAQRKLYIMSAGCASGEEPYSLAMLVRGHLTDPSWRVLIQAVDISPSALERAGKARYPAWSLRATSPEVQRRWFKPEGREFALDDSLRSAVTFDARNLADENRDLWRPDTYDVVFCRNVVMYFTPEKARALMARVARALAPGGYLFLGHAETLRGLSPDFHLRHTHGTFYYQRKDSSEPSVSPPMGRTSEWQHSAALSLVAAAEATATWVDTIQRATERIQVLVEGSSPRRSKSAHREDTIPHRAPWDLRLVFELMRKERFAEALELLLELPPESGCDPDVLLLRAALHTQSGQLELAESICARFIEADEFNACAHYLLALCREARGDQRGAVEHDQIASYLDPGFAMPRLHLGLLTRRAGDRNAAHREFEQALLLLQREDASRLLLFGGGFGREALIELCRAELAVCRGRL